MTNESFEILVVKKTRYKVVTVVFGGHVRIDLGFLNDDECLELIKTFRDASRELQPE